VIALGVLAVAILLCGFVVYFGPAAGERVVPLLSEAQQQNLPLLESLFTLIIFGSLLLFALVGGALLRFNPLRLGEKPGKRALVGLVFGAFGVVVATAYAGINGTLLGGTMLQADPAILAWGVAIILFQTASEEIYFRGWLQPVLADRWGQQAAVIVAALAFAALHVMGGARSPTTLLNMFLGGLLFGYLAAYGRGVAGPIAAHFAWNGTEQLLLGLDPNPGLGSFGAFLDLELRGAAAWGGSDEGLNASIAMTFALFALIVPLLIMARERKAKAVAASG
jgi:membrane protease YdiL (CAAX protease family)